MPNRSNPHDHDAGWGPDKITLIGGRSETISITCRWVEYSHASKGKSASAFVVVSTMDDVHISGTDWRALEFTDVAGHHHHYSIMNAKEIGPRKLRLTKVTAR